MQILKVGTLIEDNGKIGIIARVIRMGKMNFDNDGETFSKATSVADNVMLQIPHYYNPVPGVTMLQSDPIHGSLGEPKISMKDLTPEQ